MGREDIVQQIVKQDVPGLAACGTIFTYCTLANIASVAQAVGVIFGAATAIVIFFHRIYVIRKKPGRK